MKRFAIFVFLTLFYQCENVFAFGSDYDGCEIHPALCGVEKMSSVYNSLKNKGYETDLLDKLFYKNACTFFNNICK